MTTDRIGLWVLALAALLGMLGDALLRETPWGLNLGLWVMALAACVAAIPLKARGTQPMVGWLIVPVAFGMLFAWRDSLFLNMWNFLAVIAGFTLVGLRLRRPNLGLTTVFSYIAGALEMALSTAFGALILAFGDVRWLERDSEKPAGRYRSVLIGLALAAPLLLLFGALLTAADPVFERLVHAVFDWDFDTLASHMFLALFIAWLVAGYLRGIVFQEKPLTASVPEPRSPSLGIVEIGIPLGTMIAIFTIFVTIQVQYLFGGEDLIQSTLGLSYAEYARRGFFELVTVTALVVPLLLISEWMLDTGVSKNRKSFAALATVLLILVSIVMASALERMRLYVDAYGLTQDRFYATAFMLWIATVLGWLISTVLRGQRRRFAFGAIVSGFLFLAGLNIINPNAIIARTDMNRSRAVRPVDVHHLSNLSADAVPTILARIGTLDQTEQCELISLLRQRRWFLHQTDWRGWNFGRFRAKRAMQNVDRLRRDCESTPVPPTNH
jgi:hypothetical protein